MMFSEMRLCYVDIVFDHGQAILGATCCGSGFVKLECSLRIALLWVQIWKIKPGGISIGAVI
jgi:hypothetical protein